MKFFSLDPDVKVLLPDGSTRHLTDYLLPSALLMLAALMLMISMFLPYWSMTMHAPQYPKGLRVDVYLNHLEGDMFEIDELNHYLGMPTLGHSIDPPSALGGAVTPFTPPLLGEGTVGQFGTVAAFGIGFYLAVGAVAVVLAGLWFHRAAYKPIVDARKRIVSAGKATRA
ncbi:MAG: hypothetical protein HZB20_09350 [Chloroflexi bacterium]|nr:hypothetical protein [Chloroflexota bacterium]